MGVSSINPFLTLLERLAKLNHGLLLGASHTKPSADLCVTELVNDGNAEDRGVFPSASPSRRNVSLTGLSLKIAMSISGSSLTTGSLFVIVAALIFSFCRE